MAYKYIYYYVYAHCAQIFLSFLSFQVRSMCQGLEVNYSIHTVIFPLGGRGGGDIMMTFYS